MGPHNVLVLKSGTDFRDMTRVDVVLPAGGENPQLTWTRLTMDSSVPEDLKVKKIVESYMGEMTGRMKDIIGYSQADLDGRFTSVRTCESNLGNFVCDVVRLATESDLVIINGGSFRSDVIHPAGPFTLGDLMSILPMMETTVVIEATGKQIIGGLENGVSMYPKLEGRFPQVSGITFKFDPSQPPQSRIVSGSVLIGDCPLEEERKYKLCTKSYIAAGKDGYDVFLGCRTLVDEEDCVVMAAAVRNHFRHLMVLGLMDDRVMAVKAAKVWINNTPALSKKANLREDNAEELNGALQKGAGAEAEENNKAEQEEKDGDGLEDIGELRSPSRHQLKDGENGLCMLDEGHFSIKPVIEGRIIAV